MLSNKEKTILENYFYDLIVESVVSLKESDKDKDDSDKDSSKRKDKEKIVLKWLKNDVLNNAAIMRKLWNPNKEDEDAKRSYFYKCRDGELNDAGYPYTFTDSEITSLYKIKSQGV